MWWQVRYATLSSVPAIARDQSFYYAYVSAGARNKKKDPKDLKGARSAERDQGAAPDAAPTEQGAVR